MLMFVGDAGSDVAEERVAVDADHVAAMLFGHSWHGVVLCVPRYVLNARRTCRRELLDRTLIWNQARLLRILRKPRDPPQSAPPAPVPARRRVTETDTRTGRS